MCQTLMQSIHISQKEYPNAYGTEGWRKAIRTSVNTNYGHRFPPNPQTSPESEQRASTSVGVGVARPATLPPASTPTAQHNSALSSIPRVHGKSRPPRTPNRVNRQPPKPHKTAILRAHLRPHHHLHNAVSTRQTATSTPSTSITTTALSSTANLSRDLKRSARLKSATPAKSTLPASLATISFHKAYAIRKSFISNTYTRGRERRRPPERPRGSRRDTAAGSTQATT
jgi:hypothetical protein